MREIILPSRYFVIFLTADGCTQPIGEEVAPEAAFSRMEAYQIASNGTNPDFPFADPQAVVIRSAHPLGDWGEHSCARFVNGKMVFPFA